MSFFTKMSDAATLMSGMATRLDVDIAHRMAADPENVAGNYASMVTRCAQCSEHAACARLQDENPALDAAPDYCMNLNSLRRAD